MKLESDIEKRWMPRSHNVIIEEEKESTSPESEEKKEKVETILEMNVWGGGRGGGMHELNNEIEPYILEVEGTLNKYGRATKWKKAPRSLRRHASLQHYVLKQLPEHKFHFLGMSRGLDHHLFHGWLSLVGL